MFSYYILNCNETTYSIILSTDAQSHWVKKDQTQKQHIHQKQKQWGCLCLAVVELGVGNQGSQPQASP